MVAAAAYRFGVTLRDERYGVTHRYSGKRGMAHAEILAPAGAPAWVRDREMLWNRVEAGERRKDSQLARLIEIGLPVELSLGDNVALVRDYIAGEFVSQGMVADFCIRGDSGNPHSHILLTLRRATESGFGPKERRWNGKAALIQWRTAWAERANEHLARAGHLVRIDHRTLEAQQIELAPGRKIGVAPARQNDETLPSHLSERISEQQRVARANGEFILQDPTAVLRALTHQKPIFTRQELSRYLRYRTHGAEQLAAAYRAVTESPELVALTSGNAQEERFTSRDMIEAAKSVTRRTAAMAARRGHAVAAAQRSSSALQFSLDHEQRRAFDYVLQDGDVKALIMAGGLAKQTLLSALRHAHEAAGLRALNLAAREAGSGQLESMTRETVLCVDGAEMLGLKQMERLLAAADRARTKIVLIGDAAQLHAMKVETAFQTVFRAVGHPESAIN